MAYADRDRTGENTVGIGITVVLVALLSWALYSGLAAEGFRAIVKKVTAVDIKKDEPKKEEKPPPPKKEAAPPPIVVPPPITNINTRPPPVEVTTQAAPPPVIEAPVLAPPAPPAAPPPPPPKQATPRGNPAGWVTNDDYPTRAMREERQGTTGFRLTVGTDGRPTDCTVTSSSGSPDLDSTACSLLMRRAKFNPATQNGQPVTGTWSSRFRWVIPQE